ncbi:hypothetical protein J6590_029869 [Homalodisca vitripennis]|nr:hypothetical protein J6590_029869 [Homalodisca vitripennis]
MSYITEICDRHQLPKEIQKVKPRSTSERAILDLLAHFSFRAESVTYGVEKTTSRRSTLNVHFATQQAL